MVFVYKGLGLEKEDYALSKERFESGIISLGIESLSLIEHGSSTNGSFVPCISDIDYCLVLPIDVCIDKRLMYTLAQIYLKAVESKPDMKGFLSVSPIDMTVLRDGRFSDYFGCYKDTFNDDNSRIVTGPDCRKYFNMLDTNRSDQSELATKLRKARQRFVYSQALLAFSPSEFASSCEKTFGSMLGSTYHLYFLGSGGKTLKRKTDALKELSSLDVFSGVDFSALERLSSIARSREEISRLFQKPDEMLELWADSLGFLESMIKAYIEHTPNQ